MRSSIYGNDNFGQWRSDFSKLLDYCVRPEPIGKSFVEQIQPDENDHFVLIVLKPMHSGFYQTPLEVLLRYLDAHDAKMRQFELYVPSDCSASPKVREHRQAIEHIRMMTDAKVVPSRSLRLHESARAARK